MSTPMRRGMDGSVEGYLLWRCLWVGSLQMIRTPPRRRTILQLAHMRRTLDLTFISDSPFAFAAIDDAALGEVVRRHLDRDLVPGEDADVVHAHLATDVRED